MNQFKQLANAGITSKETGKNFTLVINNLRYMVIPKTFDKKFNNKNDYAD